MQTYQTFEQDGIIKRILAGDVFIYPTDTIYGIGCDATNNSSVRKIRDIKQQFEQPFSVIAPNKAWIMNNCDIKKSAQAWLDKLPGPYTLILKLKVLKSVAQEVTLGKQTVGVRIINHEFQNIVSALNKPIVTTSANLHKQPFATSLENISPQIKDVIDFAIDDGLKQGRPSTIIDLSGDVRIIER